MAHISLVLPFALPAPEFAPDLTRALQAPALATLLSKTSDVRYRPLEAEARALPHELWIARALGLAHGLVPGVAAKAMRGCGLDPDNGMWFVVNPTHIQIARTHLQMGDVRQLDLREAEARALFDSARPCFEELGYALAWGAPDTWFMRADDWTDLATASPDAAVNMNLTDWMPSGGPARAFRKLQNDVQVTWFTDPANAAREARGQLPINSFWPWGNASMATEHASQLVAKAAGKPIAAPRVAAFAAGWRRWPTAAWTPWPASTPCWTTATTGCSPAATWRRPASPRTGPAGWRRCSAWKRNCSRRCWRPSAAAASRRCASC